MTLGICISLLLSTSIAPVFFRKSDRLLIGIAQLLMIALTGIMTAYAFYQQQPVEYTWQFLDFNRINLILSIQFDTLAKIMMIFILVIGFLIYRYAQNYLESDQTRMRFLSQFNLVLCSVLLLVMSSNLLTAFVAWQLMGINLYLLLNHYHNDPAANRAAKKKFVINRIGDCSFLLAIILVYQTGSATSFAAIQSSPHAELVCGLLFISVMTKCAQFPFHVWLIDTMETPTPVSALMHAGVINAGGILLARVSSTLVTFHDLAFLILLVGLVSAVFSIQWMNQQVDTKKKLAYSTMGQMGYMLTQCSLGAFPAAIFHLMSHGFYKASLFLNAGETLKRIGDNNQEPVHFTLIMKALLIAMAILLADLLLFKNHVVQIPLLMYGFIFMTLVALVLKADFAAKAHWSTPVLYYLLLTALFSGYLYCLEWFSHLLPHYEYSGTVSLVAQASALLILFSIQIFLWLKKTDPLNPVLRDRTEEFLRCFLLNPLRAFGNIINSNRYRNVMKVIYFFVMIVTVAGFFYGLFYHAMANQQNADISQWFTFSFLLTGIVALVIANRCLSIKSLILYLALFELAFVNLAWFDNDHSMVKIGCFHLINITATLMMLALLARENTTKQIKRHDTNRLPPRVFYLTFGLLLLIGIPGTASFVSEFYLLSALINSNFIFVLMYISLIVLAAIVVMHSLQLYAFNKNYAFLLSSPISKQDHWIFLMVIGLNIFCGLYPNVLLSHL